MSILWNFYCSPINILYFAFWDTHRDDMSSSMSSPCCPHIVPKGTTTALYKAYWLPFYLFSFHILLKIFYFTATVPFHLNTLYLSRNKTQGTPNRYTTNTYFRLVCWGLRNGSFVACTPTALGCKAVSHDAKGELMRFKKEQTPTYILLNDMKRYFLI